MLNTIGGSIRPMSEGANDGKRHTPRTTQGNFDLLSSLRWNSWTTFDLERLLNEGSPSGFSKNKPKRGLGSQTGMDAAFDVPLYDLGERVTTQNFGDASDYWSSHSLFPVHPDMAGQIEGCLDITPVRYVKALATSSGRTVYVFGGGPPGYLKLSYMGLLGRVTRIMTSDHILSAIEVSKVMSQVLPSAAHPRFSIYPENSGVALTGILKGWGYTTRQEPVPERHDATIAVPGFALFSQRFGNRAVRPLIHSILRYRGEELIDPLNFYTEFLAPLIESYFGILAHSGLQIEAHAQNLVWHFDSEWRVAYIAYRDMESVDKDWPLVEKNSLSQFFTPMTYKTLHRDGYNYQIMHSFMFDFKLGEYMLHPLLKSWRRMAGAEAYAAIILLVRNEVDRLISQLPTNFMPSEWYDYPAVIHEGSVSGKRPYTAHSGPRFRSNQVVR